MSTTVAAAVPIEVGSSGAPRIIACPDSLKGALSARDAAAALALGASEAGARCDELPLADGGEGTADVLASTLGGTWHTAVVTDPLGRPVRARFLVLDRDRAVVETAEAIGLPLLRPDERDPLVATSEGVGELLLAVAATGVREILVALGGTATVDGGAGMRRILAKTPLPASIRLRALCDVSNPLLGPNGAARVFGPQKGASPADVEELERRLSCDLDLRPYASLPGAGAAGGLGAAFAAVGAELLPGAEVVLEAVGFSKRIVDATLIVTGEGCVDTTSSEGKLPGAVAEACERAGVPCLVFGGRVEDRSRLRARGAGAVLALSGVPERAREDLVGLGYALGRLVVALRPQGRPPQVEMPGVLAPQEASGCA